MFRLGLEALLNACVDRASRVPLSGLAHARQRFVFDVLWHCRFGWRWYW